MSRIWGRSRGIAPTTAPTSDAGDVTARLAALGDRRAADVLELATAQLASGAARIAVLGPRAGADVVALLAAIGSVAPDASVHVADPAAGESELHVQLAATGPYDVLVDAARDDEGVRARRARAVLLHLRKGGVLVVEDARPLGSDPVAPPPGADQQAGPQSFAVLVADALRFSLARKGTRTGTGPGAEQARGWGRAVRSVTVGKGHLALVNHLPARAKIREDEVARLLELRPDDGRVLRERPGSLVVNPQPIRQSPTDHPWELETRFEAPAMQLREYRNVICWPGQVVTQRNVLLPETYRHLARPRLRSQFVEDVSPRFGRVIEKGGAELLPGTYFHLDSEFRGHFGHAVTEQISRLWAWDEVKRHAPDARALVLVNRQRTSVADWEYRLYEAAGVAREDIVLADGPVRVERLLAATPMFSQPQFVHAGILDVYRTIGDHLAAEAPERDYPERIFCSRKLSKRACTNTPDVEAFFTDLGFTIVYPEDHSLGEQVQMFRAARDVAGFGGSAMFTMAFATGPKRVFLVSSENYWAQNETVIAAVRGHQVNVAWCRPEKTKEAGFTGKALLHSPFTFDADREGRFLREAFETPLSDPVRPDGGAR